MSATSKAYLVGGGSGSLAAAAFMIPVTKETGGGAHGVSITAPSLIAFNQGVGMTRRRGTCVLIGLPSGEFPVPLFDVVANCLTIRGSFVGTRQDMAEALAFAADAKVKADIELQPLSSMNDVLNRLERGEVASRVVLESANWSLAAQFHLQARLSQRPDTQTHRWKEGHSHENETHGH